jgi:lysyl-tRNA synthetase class 2
MKILKLTRQILESLGYQEVETPLLVPSPGMEPHIRPLRVFNYKNPSSPIAFLPTSPEFAMKRLLAGGLGSIFQISRSFRDEPQSPEHLHEFTMLEFYKVDSKLDDLMSDVEKFLTRLFSFFPGISISLKAPFPRFTVRELFRKYTGIELKEATTSSLLQFCTKKGLLVPKNATWDDLYFLIWLNEIEANLPKNTAYFVTEYPESQAALAETGVDSDGFRIAHRFEIYVGRYELGNAFQELRDPKIQRDRFNHDMNLREKIYGNAFPKTPIDEGFLEALEEGLPPCSGIAIGLDRLVMIAANENDIQYTHWLMPYREPGS